MDFIPEGLAVFDRDLRLVTSNHRYSELLALPARLVAPGTPLYDIALFLGRGGRPRRRRCDVPGGAAGAGTDGIAAHRDAAARAPMGRRSSSTRRACPMAGW